MWLFLEILWVGFQLIVAWLSSDSIKYINFTPLSPFCCKKVCFGVKFISTIVRILCMLKQKISCLVEFFRAILTEVSTHVVSFLSLQAMRFSIQTAIKLMILIFFPNLAFMIKPILLTV